MDSLFTYGLHHSREQPKDFLAFINSPHFIFAFEINLERSGHFSNPQKSPSYASNRLNGAAPETLPLQDALIVQEQIVSRIDRFVLLNTNRSGSREQPKDRLIY
jgi:hypothetical protein